MSAYNESDKGEWVYNHVYTLIKEIAKGPKSYKQYSQDIVEKVLNELDKGGISIKVDFDDPVTGAYYTIVQSNSIDAEAKAVSRILMDFDELSEAGFKVDGNQQIFLYRLYELSCNRQVDVKSISVSDFKKLTRYADWIGKLGTMANAVEWAGYAGNALSALADGNIKGATDELASCISSSACGFISGQIATALISAFAVTNPLVAFATFAVLGLLGNAIGDEVAEGWKMIFDEIFGLYDEAGAYTYPVDPLIFDLNGDGVKTVALADGVHFDFDKNGFAEKIGWVSPEDGLLVRDMDKNGKIDSGRELMGDLTELSDDLVAANGFEALAYFDANADGVIDAKDDIYRELQIWQDKNQNGMVDDGELMSLEEAGIASINLAYDSINVIDESGNGHSQKSTYTRTDGTILSVEDVWFEKDAANTVVKDTTEQIMLEETSDIAGLPDIQGKGNQYSLHQAMLRDETGVLKQMVEDYVAETDRVARRSMLPEIIYVWTGVNEIEAESRGNGISDARKLVALEVITGRDFNSAYGMNPVRQAGVYLEQAFDKLVGLYFGQLEMQTTYADEYAELYMNLNLDENGKIVYDLTSIASKYMAGYADNPVEGRNHIFDFVDNLRKTGMDLAIGKDKICEAFPITMLDIYHAIDYRGDDVISGTNGDDIIIGEMGNDTLRGGQGDDIYIFNLGDGQDMIEETGGTDRIVFGEGITAENIEISRDTWNLYLSNKKSGDRIGIRDFFNSTTRQVEEVRFADGTGWSMEDLKDKARYYHGTEGNDNISGRNSYSNAPAYEDDYLYGGAGDDTLYGNNGNDELYGEEGNDTLDGGYGNDLLNGGTGNDTLRGGQGDDIYIFNLGDGQDMIEETGGTDRIVFGEGITAENIEISRDTWNLYLSNKKSGDRIGIRDFFNSTTRQVEEVRFADGTGWSMEDLKDKARYYHGTEGNDSISGRNSYSNAPAYEDDYLYGGAGDDTLYGNNGNDELYGEEGNDTLDGGNGNDILNGGTGNDTLRGGQGDDIYIFNLGDGQDTIQDAGGNDRIMFGDGIDSEDLIFTKNGYNLNVSITGQEDKITVLNYFNNESYRVESIQTSDGTEFDYARIELMIQAMASFGDSNGMMMEAVAQNTNEQANDASAQMWTKALYSKN